MRKHRFGVSIVDIVGHPEIGSRVIQLGWHWDHAIEIKRRFAVIIGATDGLTKATNLLDRTSDNEICTTPVWHLQSLNVIGLTIERR